jgi:hypothetical protein
MQSRDWSRKRQEQIEKTSSMPKTENELVCLVSRTYQPGRAEFTIFQGCTDAVRRG